MISEEALSRWEDLATCRRGLGAIRPMRPCWCIGRARGGPETHAQAKELFARCLSAPGHIEVSSYIKNVP